MNNLRKYKKDDCILFNSKLDSYVMSNMYPCRLVYDSKEFQSVEQMFHWMLFSGNTEVRDGIMKCKGVCNGFQVKNFCAKHADKIDKDYDSKKFDCLFKCLEIKYLQCLEFRKAIDESVGKSLVEYAPWDNEYGAVWDKDLQSYVGKNACGRLMMKVRENALNGLYNFFNKN